MVVLEVIDQQRYTILVDGHVPSTPKIRCNATRSPSMGPGNLQLTQRGPYRLPTTRDDYRLLIGEEWSRATYKVLRRASDSQTKEPSSLADLLFLEPDLYDNETVDRRIPSDICREAGNDGYMPMVLTFGTDWVGLVDELTPILNGCGYEIKPKARYVDLDELTDFFEEMASHLTYAYLDPTHAVRPYLFERGFVDVSLVRG